MLIGYARVSTTDQDLRLQKDALQKTPSKTGLMSLSVHYFPSRVLTTHGAANLARLDLGWMLTRGSTKN